MNTFKLPYPVFAADGPGSAPPSPASGGATAPSSPAPASSPATAPSVTPPATGGLKDAAPESSDMFAGIGLDDLDNLVNDSPVPPVATPAVATPATPAPDTTPVPPQAQPAPQPQPQPAPGPQPQPAATPAAPAATATTPAPAAEEPDVLAQLEANAAALIAGIASEQFQLSPEQIGKLQEAPNEVIPQLAARIYYMANMNALRHVKNAMANLPVMMDRFLQVRDQNRKIEDNFYSMWPKLNRSDAKVNELVQRTALTYKQANPQMPQDEFLKNVGVMVSTHLGLPLEMVTAAPSAGAPAPATGVKPPVVVPVSSAFVPAATGGAPALPQPGPASQNPWEMLGQDFDEG